MKQNSEEQNKDFLVIKKYFLQHNYFHYEAVSVFAVIRYMFRSRSSISELL